MTSQASFLEGIVDYFWSSEPPNERAASLRMAAIQWYYGLGWWTRNFSSWALAEGRRRQAEYRRAVLG